MAHLGAVSTGQRYIKTYHYTHDQTEWEVVEVKVVGAALPHAQLVNCRDPFDIRTVSCVELTAGGAFDLAEDAGDAQTEAAGGQLQAAGSLAAGSARVGRLLRQVTLAVRNFKKSRLRRPTTAKAVVTAAREARRTT